MLPPSSSFFLDRCLKYINRNAYIETNLFGYSFCNAAMEAFHTLINNFVQVAAHNFVGGLVFFTLRLMVISMNMVIAYYWIRGNYSELYSISIGNATVNSTVETAELPGINFAAPMFIIALFTYFVVGAFTELLEMTTDTILICFCEDVKFNEASNGTLLAPKSLLDALGLYKKQMKGEEAAATAALAATEKTAETSFRESSSAGSSPPAPGEAAAAAPVHKDIGNF